MNNSGNSLYQIPRFQQKPFAILCNIFSAPPQQKKAAVELIGKMVLRPLRSFFFHKSARNNPVFQIFSYTSIYHITLCDFISLPFICLIVRHTFLAFTRLDKINTISAISYQMIISYLFYRISLYISYHYRYKKPNILFHQERKFVNE